MRISQVTARSGVPETTLRYYETVGLIDAQRLDNGYRHFDENILDRLEFIHAAKQLHLGLPEIRSLLQLVDTGTCTKVKAALHPLLTEQLARLDATIDDLTTLREHLHDSLRQVAACPDSNEPCRSECAFDAVLPPSPANLHQQILRRRSPGSDELLHTDRLDPSPHQSTTEMAAEVLTEIAPVLDEMRRNNPTMQATLIIDAGVLRLVLPSSPPDQIGRIAAANPPPT